MTAQSSFLANSVVFGGKVNVHASNESLPRIHTFHPVTLSGLAARVIPTAAVEPAQFHRARSGSKGMPWL
jgi:hypothetical protein